MFQYGPSFFGVASRVTPPESLFASEATGEEVEPVFLFLFDLLKELAA